MPHDDMITIHADILQVTDAAVLITCGGEEVWLPLSQIDFDGERGDMNVSISLPEWLADEKGLSDGDGMKRAVVTTLSPTQNVYRSCQKCVHYSDNENYMPDVCYGCSQANGDATEDHWEEAPTNPEQPETVTLTGSVMNYNEVKNGEAREVIFAIGHEDEYGNYDETEYTIPLNKVLSKELNEDDVDKITLARAYAVVLGLVQSTEDDESDHALPRPAEASFLKTEFITVSVPLDPAERESVGDRMASALEKISELEDDLDSYRKSINAQIKSLQKDAEAARKEWQEGKTEQEVYCDVMADYGQEAIIWLDHDTGDEMKRRPMTAEERQYRLPIPRPGDSTSTTSPDLDDGQTAPPPMGETIGTPHATNRHTCLDCGHMLDNEDGRQAEECASCNQSGSGEADNWTPRRECRTCSHSHATIDLPPCKGCALNVMPEHRGDEDRWEWTDATRESADISGPTCDAGSTDNAPGATEQEAYASV